MQAASQSTDSTNGNLGLARASRCSTAGLRCRRTYSGNWVGGRKGSTMTISGRSKASMVAGGVQSACDKGTTVAPAASKIYNSHAISNDLLKSYETIGRASSRERVCQYV